MNRRRVLKTGGLAMLGLGLGGCGSKHAADKAVSGPPPRPPVKLVPVDASWDRVIRTTVGLRPHRPSGFVLREEKLDAKTLIHNYGHGGAGMSLSWGTSTMAAEMAQEHRSRRAAVLGCGVVGLTSAIQLQRRGFEVTIYAENVPPHTTSNMSLASWTPTSGLLNFRSRTPEFEAQFRRAVVLAYRELQLRVGPANGLTWIKNYTPTNSERSASGSNALMPAEASPPRVLLLPGEHPFPTKYAVQRDTLRFVPAVYLDGLVREFHARGGKIVIRKIESRRDITWLSESLIVNCMGLGAKPVLDDEELIPLKGQLTALVPQDDVNYGTSGGLASSSATPGIGIHMLSRSDGIILGGTSDRGVWSLEVNEAERTRIVEGHIALFDAMRDPEAYRRSQTT